MGRPFKNPSDGRLEERLEIRIDEETLERLKSRAKDLGIGVSEYIRRVVEEELKEEPEGCPWCGEPPDKSETRYGTAIMCGSDGCEAPNYWCCEVEDWNRLSRLLRLGLSQEEKG